MTTLQPAISPAIDLTSAPVQEAPALDLSAPFAIGNLLIPGRVALAPMAGVSVQAFRRQGRRFGASMVCSEMVSACGIHYGNERTQGYLRIARDERPIAVQLFGTDPALMADAAQQTAAAGADIIDINMGCPVKKVTKTAAGCALLDDHDRAVAVTRAVVEATPLPVTVKIRRGMRNGSRDCLALGPRLVEEAGASALTLHPRSAAQMYTGFADHSLTAELVQLVDVPVFASGDIVSNAHARYVLHMTGAAAVMIGRAAQGNPWLLHQIVTGEELHPEPHHRVAELVAFGREVANEMGDRRATGFLRKFYGWYLRGDGFSRELRRSVMELPDSGSVERLLFAQFPEAERIVEAREQTNAHDDRLLELPISIYGGG